MSALKHSSHDQANQDERKQAEQLERHDIRFALDLGRAVKCLCSVGAIAMLFPPLDARCCVRSPS